MRQRGQADIPDKMPGNFTHGQGRAPKMRPKIPQETRLGEGAGVGLIKRQPVKGALRAGGAAFSSKPAASPACSKAP